MTWDKIFFLLYNHPQKKIKIINDMFNNRKDPPRIQFTQLVDIGCSFKKYRAMKNPTIPPIICRIVSKIEPKYLRKEGL